MLQFLVEIVLSPIFYGILRWLEGSRLYLAIVLLVAAGVCVATLYFQTGTILSVIPVALTVLGLLAVFLIGRRLMAHLPDPPAQPPAPLAAAPLPELDRAVAPARFDYAAQVLPPEVRRRQLWYYALCGLAGLAGQMFGYLLETSGVLGSTSGTVRLDVATQLICGWPFGLAAGLIAPLILAPTARTEKLRWLEKPTRWGLGLSASFIAGLIIFFPAYVFIIIAASM